MILPIVLIHGYGGEGRPSEVRQIYGDLPEVLYHRYGTPRPVVINLSRFITLEDGVTLYDLAPLVRSHETTLVEIQLYRYGRGSLFRLYPYQP